jgi:hypothetical protein
VEERGMTISLLDCLDSDSQSMTRVWSVSDESLLI